MMTKLKKYAGWADAFYDYVRFSDEHERAEAAKEKVKDFQIEIQQQCSKEVSDSFNWMVDKPSTVGGHKAWEMFVQLDPPIPHWNEIHTVYEPLMAESTKRVCTDRFPGCRSLKHSRVMYELMEYPNLPEKWDKFLASIEEERDRVQLSLETKVQFKNGDKVKFTSGQHKGTYGVLKHVESEWSQCEVSPVKVDIYGNPNWNTVRYTSSYCGFYQELVKV